MVVVVPCFCIESKEVKTVSTPLLVFSIVYSSGPAKAGMLISKK